jgi:pyruvate kinase
MDIDGLGLSFVQTGELVSKIRDIAPGLVLVAKVENSEGLRNCVDIVQHSDAIMVDRGDLAAEIGFDHLFDAINIISDQTKAHGKPLIMATENLETMVERNVPSKSEVMSIAHSASIGVDCIMLSEETATAETGQATVAWLGNFLKSCSRVNQPQSPSTLQKKFEPIWHCLSSLEQMPIVIATKSGYALFDYFSVMPEGDAILVTQNKKLSKICNLYANKIEVVHKDLGNAPSETLWGLINDNKDWLFEKSEQIVALYVAKYVNSARANSITIFDRSDFDL